MTINLEKVKNELEKSAREWLVEHENVDNFVRRILDRNFENMVKAAIGFKKNTLSREWEPVETYGNPYTVFGKEIYEAISRKAKLIAAEIIESSRVEFSESEKNKMRSHYRARLKEQIMFELENRAKERAKEILNKFIDEIIVEE